MNSSNPFFPSKVNQWPKKEDGKNNTNDDKAGSTVSEWQDFGVHSIDTCNKHRWRKHTW